MNQTVHPSNHVATIDGKPMIEDLVEFRVESSLLSLHVTDESVLKNELEVPIEKGTWQAVDAGYCIIIKSLPRSD
jgi:hypothetical protein